MTSSFSPQGQQSAVDKQPLNEESVQRWIFDLEQWTNVFYNVPNAQNPALWQQAQTKLLQFQKIHDPFELCIGILKRSRNPLVLYQATLCLKNSVTNDFKKTDSDELFKLFQFLYEFLTSQALENETPVNETTALICAIILKRIAGDKSNTMAIRNRITTGSESSTSCNEDSDKIIRVITTLCGHIKDPNGSLCAKYASALMLSSLLLECQMSNRSTSLGIRIWKLFAARKLIDTQLKVITEVCLDTINIAFSTNLLQQKDRHTREGKVVFDFVATLIQCIEYALSFNSTETGCSTGSDRVLRVIQSRTINMLAPPHEHDQRTKMMREWCGLLMSPEVVQFLFNLYSTVKSMLQWDPTWDWTQNVLKSCLNCLYYLSDIHNYIFLEKGESYANFVGNLMMGAKQMMETENRGIDDIYQISCLITSISMHTSETRDTITMIKPEHFLPFLEAAKTFTEKVLVSIATGTVADQEEEEKAVDALLDFWFHLLRNIEAEIRYCLTSNSQATPKLTMNDLKTYSNFIMNCYVRCHIHQPIGFVTRNASDDQEVDLDQAEEHDDNNLYSQQLVTFGLIARFDAESSSKLLTELLGARVSRLEELLMHHINLRGSPDGLEEWEKVNDDIHWLLLMVQHFFTQTGYGEIGFMCNEILNLSLNSRTNLQKTIEGLEKCDHNNPEVDPVARMISVALKLCQLEIGICQAGKMPWLSLQTNASLTTLLSRFCLTYLYPKESDYSVISENMNFCFGCDSPTAEKFLRFVIEHTCCIILHTKGDDQTVKKNVQLLIHLLSLQQSNTKSLMNECEEGSMTKALLCQLRPDNISGFSSRVAKSIIQLATRLFVDDSSWDKLIEFFTNKWAFIINCIQNQQHQSEMVCNKLLEFCDFTMGVCEACDDETSERLFEQLLVPIVKEMPAVLRAFANFESIPISVFDMLFHMVKNPLVHISNWDDPNVKAFYENCTHVIDSFSHIALARKDRGDDEEDCEDIISVLNFCHEVMKRDWGSCWATCDAVVKFAIEKLGQIIKPDYMQFPRIRTVYYRLLVYLVDDEDRLNSLSEKLLEIIVSSLLLSLKTSFDRDVDNHTYTIIAIVCRTIYHERDNETGERLARFMNPVLPALFQASIAQGTYCTNSETAELVAPALFSLRCCFPDTYKMLVEDLIQKQDDHMSRSKVKSLFETLESKIHKFPLNRSACRDFNALYVPFIAELQNYVASK